MKITSKPILYNGSPGSSNKSGGSHKDDDGDGDEKNPDVIPDSSEEQVSSSNGEEEKESAQKRMCKEWEKRAQQSKKPGDSLWDVVYLYELVVWANEASS